MCGNTTLDRHDLNSISQAELEQLGPGGLSGAPLYLKALQLTSWVNEHRRKEQIIIGCGGIDSGEKARRFMNIGPGGLSGADLVQLYTGLVYEGPDLINQINAELNRPH